MWNETRFDTSKVEASCERQDLGDERDCKPPPPGPLFHVRGTVISPYKNTGATRVEYVDTVLQNRVSWEEKRKMQERMWTNFYAAAKVDLSHEWETCGGDV